MTLWRLSAIDRKLFRDTWHTRGQVAAIVSVIACGVAAFVMSLTAMQALRSTQAAYYDRYGFTHVFANLKRAPSTLIPRIAEIPGVAGVQTRVVREVLLDIPAIDDPAVGKLISIPARSPGELNRLHLRTGRFIEPGRDNEVLVAAGFAEARGYRPGDTLTTIINGRKKELRIVGTVLSPEYIYIIRLGSLVPDDGRYAIMWMEEQALEAAFDMEGSFNDVALDLMHGADEATVIDDLDRLLEPYGGLGAHNRRDQISHRFVSDEIKQLEKMGTIVPSLFLSVAAFLLNVVLSRIIALQRDQIAVLKAFGYSNLEVGLHFFKLVLFVVVVGVLLGCAGGSVLGRQMTDLYANFYKFPLLLFSLPGWVIALSFLVSLFAAAMGTLNVIRRAVKLPPAEAMRPEPPASYRPTLVERIGFSSWLSQPARMIIRHIERRPVKSLLSIAGLAVSVAVQMLGRFPADSLNHLVQVQFDVVERQHLRINLYESASWRGVHELEHLPGVLKVEPRKLVVARILSGQIQRRTLIQGLPEDSTMSNLIDERGHTVPLPSEGLVINSKLAEVLQVGVGDLLTIQFLQGTRQTVQVPVRELITENLGTFAYMNLRALNRLMREGNSFSDVNVAFDPRYEKAMYDKIKQMPGAAAVSIKSIAIANFRHTVMDNMLHMQFFNVIFACIIAFGVVYNTARIALSERGRELASLRVLGLTRGEISFILLGELAVLTLAAIPLGIALGLGLARLVCYFLNSEMYRIPFVLTPRTIGISVLMVLVSAVISGLVVRRQLDRLDLIAVLKTRE